VVQPDLVALFSCWGSHHLNAAGTDSPCNAGYRSNKLESFETLEPLGSQFLESESRILLTLGKDFPFSREKTHRPN
jgi:hypothetical protein